MYAYIPIEAVGCDGDDASSIQCIQHAFVTVFVITPCSYSPYETLNPMHEGQKRSQWNSESDTQSIASGIVLSLSFCFCLNLSKLIQGLISKTNLQLQPVLLRVTMINSAILLKLIVTLDAK